MDKIINEQQLNTVLQLLEKYNVGILEYTALRKMFKELPDISKSTPESPVVEEDTLVRKDE